MQPAENAVVQKNKLFWLIAIITVSFLMCYWTTIKGLMTVWMNDEDYSYAFLIPFITAYLIWERRRQIASTSISINWIGGKFFFIFLIVSLYGILGSSPSAVRPAIPLIILSIILFCFGWEMFKVLSFPLAMLIFMIPLPTLYGAVIGVHLKTISTILGKAFLDLAGITAFVEGNVIDLGVTQLQVVDACSGLRYVLPLLALGTLFAYFFEKSRWKQTVLVLSTIPIAILNNGIRIGATGILTEKYGPQVAEGFFHGFSGWLIFLFAFAALFAFHFVLKRLFPGSKKNAQKGPEQQSRTEPIFQNLKLLPFVVTIIGLLVLSSLGFATSSLPPFQIVNGLKSFPLEIDGWRGKSDIVDSEIIRLSGAEDAFSGTYLDRNSNVISLYLGYRGSPFVESENFFHSPNVCLPSSGWKTLTSSTHKIENVPGFGSLSVFKMVSERMGQKNITYYWFQTKSRSSSDVNINRFHLTLHALQRDNTHDLFIRPITVIGSSESIESAQIRMDQFVREFMPILLKFLEKNQVASGSALN
jgi:exosortase D (VPLPA-CTERM-specific)